MLQILSTKKKKKKGIKFLIEVFKDHIGEENGISMRSLFIKVYDKYPQDFDEFELYYKMITLQRAMNHLRRRTYAFVVFKNDLYFVVTTAQEAKEYMQKLLNTKDKIDLMLNRCAKAIKEQHYKKLLKGDTYYNDKNIQNKKRR